MFEPHSVDAIDEERRRLTSQMWEQDGARCVCCGQLVKGYKRKLYAAQAVALIHLVQIAGPDRKWIHVRRQLPLMQGTKGGGDFSKLKYWDLIEGKPNMTDPTKNQSGIWRPTPWGVKFAYGRKEVPAWVNVYDDQAVEFSDKLVSIHDVLPDGFDYEDIWKTERSA